MGGAGGTWSFVADVVGPSSANKNKVGKSLALLGQCLEGVSLGDQDWGGKEAAGSLPD